MTNVSNAFLEKMRYNPHTDQLSPYSGQKKRWLDRFTHHADHHTEPVMYYENARVLKNKNPKLCEVYQVHLHHVVLRYKCFDPRGGLRCWIHVSVSYQSLLCEDEKVVFFDGI